jgi:hypothetical protein
MVVLAMVDAGSGVPSTTFVERACIGLIVAVDDLEQRGLAGMLTRIYCRGLQPVAACPRSPVG